MKLGEEWRAKGAGATQVIVQNLRTYLLAINSQHAIVGRRALSYETIISARSVGCTTSGQPLVVSSLLQLVI